MKKCFIGIDTSNYTTSVAAVDENGEILLNARKILDVPMGSRGLRQQDALFEHVVNLPVLMEELRPLLKQYVPAAAGVSARPRDVEGSYMPCFLAGILSGVSFSSGLDIPVFRFSHQCGHIRAAVQTCGSMIPDTFGAYHVSGGTTEMLLCRKDGKSYEIKVIGGTLDVSCGQIIDRCGVMLGCAFPAGPAVERLASDYSGRLPSLKKSVSNTYFNLSGLENQLIKDFNDNHNRERTAALCLKSVSEYLSSSLSSFSSEYPDLKMIMTGGVLSDIFIRNKVSAYDFVVFGSAELSSDNAVGIALLACDNYKAGERNE